MKILHVDETFHPAYGYQVNPLAKFQQKAGHAVTILTVDAAHLYPVYADFGDHGEGLAEDDARYARETGVKIVRIRTRGYLMNRAIYSGAALRRAIREIDPDVIFVHCVETITGMRFVLFERRYPLLFDSHMLSMASANRFHRAYEAVWRRTLARIICRHGWRVIRTQDDPYVNEKLGVDPALTPFVSFGTDTLLFRPDAAARHDFRASHGIPDDEHVVIYTGKLTEAKGGMLLAEVFEKKFDPPVTLICVGDPPETDYGRAVRARLEGSENRVLMFPTQKYTDLAPFYQAADLSVFPRQCSMSFYDAQACALPVLSEDNSVNVDRCGHDNGLNFRAGDSADFRRKIEAFFALPEHERERMGQNARAFVEADYDYTDIAKTYSDYLAEAIEHHTRK